jgi:response regulator of citrate/malate metabolism
MRRPAAATVAAMVAAWRVLVVDDDRLAVAAIRTAIAACDDLALATDVRSAETATELLRDDRFDLVFLELALPGPAGGLGLVRRLRARDALVEVIAATRVREARTVRAAMQCGVVDYVVKPLAPAPLLWAIARFRSRARALTVGSDLDQDAIDDARFGPRP